MKIPFSPPYVNEDVINEVVDSLRSGWITTGPKVKALEEEIKQFLRGQRSALCKLLDFCSDYDASLVWSKKKVMR